MKPNNNIHTFINNLCKNLDIDFKYLIKTNERNISDYTIIQNLPLFYKEILTSYNECKKIQNVKSMSLEFFLCQPLWNNRFITFQGKTLYFHSWIKSGFKYVYDIVDVNGFKSPEWFLTNLKNKTNWICQYKIMKNSLKHLIANFDLLRIRYINFQCCLKNFPLFSSGYYNSQNIYDCRFFYKLFCNKIFESPLHQSTLSRNYNIQKSSWGLIYKQKILNTYDKKVAEFNFKLLNNLLSNRFYVSKWKTNIDKFCTSCPHYTEDNKHLILNCIDTYALWSDISVFLKFDITWKTIVIGFYDDVNEKTILLNNLISFIAFRIYKYKMFCRLNDKRVLQTEMRKSLKWCLRNFYFVLLNVDTKRNVSLFKKLSDFL